MFKDPAQVQIILINIMFAKAAQQTVYFVLIRLFALNAPLVSIIPLVQPIARQLPVQPVNTQILIMFATQTL